MVQKKSLIIGKGEVGNALYKVIGGEIRDKEDNSRNKSLDSYEIIHICFPFSEQFIDQVKQYQKLYRPKYTIIHSTVPVGTSRLCDAIHSPIIGIHPFLEQGLKTFVKFLGGEKASEIADYFRRKGLRVYLTNKPETTELMKILSTTKYGVDIEYTKEVRRLCDKYKVPFEMWTLWTENYNQGYEKLGYPEYKRPNLVPIMKKIGGHCVLENSKYIQINDIRPKISKVD